MACNVQVTVRKSLKVQVLLFLSNSFSNLTLVPPPPVSVHKPNKTSFGPSTGSILRNDTLTATPVAQLVQAHALESRRSVATWFFYQKDISFTITCKPLFAPSHAKNFFVFFICFLNIANTLTPSSSRTSVKKSFLDKIRKPYLMKNLNPILLEKN